MKNLYYKKNKTSAFTLVETLVAVSIFSISILGLLSVLATGISDTTYAKNKMIAAYLAQEGTEYMRNVRDTYMLYGVTGQAGWDAFAGRMTAGGASCQGANGCYFSDQSVSYSDATQPIIDIVLTACGATCPYLLYDATTGKYGYVSGTATGFTRKIRYTAINANESKVFSTVYWTQGSGSYQMTFSESLFNWVE